LPEGISTKSAQCFQPPYIWRSRESLPLEYRGLQYFPSLEYSNNLGCSPFEVGVDSDGQATSWTQGDCHNVRGDNMSESADWSGKLQVTYFFR